MHPSVIILGMGLKSDKYNRVHCHLAYEIRDIKETKQSICISTYLAGYLFKSIGQYE